jgi:hypothetical protein
MRRTECERRVAPDGYALAYRTLEQLGFNMWAKSLIFIVFLMSASAVAIAGQDATPTLSTARPSVPPSNIELTVFKDTPIQIMLDEEVRVRKIGQAIHGRTVLPIYAFDKIVIPAGSKVNGRITKIDKVSGKARTLGILNADFSPARKVQVDFDDVLLKDGTHVPFHAVVTPSSGQVMQLVSTEEAKKDEAERNKVKSAASGKFHQAEQQAMRTWQEAMRQVKAPGKLHRVERYAVTLLPVHPQYLSAGSVYFAELQDPIHFGSEPLTPQSLAAIGTPPPAGSLVHALLITPLDSATTRKGSAVEAVLSQPLFDGNRLILPEGSRLKGSVTQVQPARRFHHNGQLRIVFRQLIPPDGIEQKIVGGLEGVQARKDQHVKLDSEGGADASSPKTRYLSTGISLALGATAFRQHSDADDVGGTQQGGVGGGAAGFKLVGIIISAAVKSQPAGMAMGAFGASRSVYAHFIARGNDVVFPKHTAMEIRFGSGGRTVLPTQNPDNGSPNEPKQPHN